jgi:hypothetical protein
MTRKNDPAIRLSWIIKSFVMVLLRSEFSGEYRSRTDDLPAAAGRSGNQPIFKLYKKVPLFCVVNFLVENIGVEPTTFPLQRDALATNLFLNFIKKCLCFA